MKMMLGKKRRIDLTLLLVVAIEEEMRSNRSR